MSEINLAATLLLSGAFCLVLVSLRIYSRSTPARIILRLNECEAAVVEASKLTRQFREEHLSREAAQVRFEEEVHNLLEEARNNSRRAAQHRVREEKAKGLIPGSDGAPTRPLTEEEARIEHERRMPSF